MRDKPVDRLVDKMLTWGDSLRMEYRDGEPFFWLDPGAKRRSWVDPRVAERAIQKGKVVSIDDPMFPGLPAQTWVLPS